VYKHRYLQARFPREVYAHVLEEDVGQAEPVHDCDEMEGGDVVESTLQVVEPPAHVVDHVQPTSLVSPPMAMVCVDPTLEGPVEEVVHPPVVDTDHVKESQTGASFLNYIHQNLTLWWLPHFGNVSFIVP